MFNSGWSSVKGGEDDILSGIGKLSLYILPIAGPIAAGYWFYKTQKELIHQVLDTTMTISGWAAVAGGVLTSIYSVLKMYQASQKQPLAALQITPKSNVKVNPTRVASGIKEFRQLYQPFFCPRVWIKWQIIRDKDGKYHFKLICPVQHKKVLKVRLANAYPDCIISEVSPELPDFYNPEDGEAAHMKLSARGKERGLKPFEPYDMGDILSLMELETILEVMISPSSIRPIRKSVKKKIEKIKKTEEPDKELIKQIEMRNEGDRTAFDVIISVWGKNGIGALVGDISAKTEQLNKLVGRPYRFFQSKRDSLDWDDRWKSLAIWRRSKLTDKELAPFFYLPHEAHRIWEHIPIEYPRPYVPDNAFSGDYGVGLLDTDNPNKKGRIARLNTDTLTNHGLIAGASGGGKGSALMTFIKGDFLDHWINDPANSMGMTICDPHTEDILLILSHLLDMEEQGIEIPWHRVKVVSFGELGAMHYPVAANLLHVPTGGNLDRVARDTAETILSAYDSSNLSESSAKLTTAIQGLLHMKRKVSLLDIVRLFEYSEEGAKLRREAIQGLTGKNDVIATDWKKIDQEILDMEKDKKVAAIQTRLSPLVAMKTMQRFFCREENFFSNIPQFFENGDLVLIDFKGADDEIFRLCTAWLATQYFNDAQKRGTGKRPHLLVFDECQKFKADDAFFKILTENRKFNLGLILITQAVEALDERLKSSIKTNAGFIISVRQNDGAKAMADLLGSPFEVEELKGLEKGREACLSSFDGKARLLLDYPAYQWQGQATERGSDEEEQAKARAEQKMLELLARDHKPVEEADKEIQQFVYGSALTLVETAATNEDKPQPKMPAKKREVAKLKVVRKL